MPYESDLKMTGGLIRFVIMKIITGVTSEWSYRPGGLSKGGLIEQGPLYYVSLTVYVSISVYLLPISKY